MRPYMYEIYLNKGHDIAVGFVFARSRSGAERRLKQHFKRSFDTVIQLYEVTSDAPAEGMYAPEYLILREGDPRVIRKKGKPTPGGLGEAAPKRYKRPPREGTRVRFDPNPVSRMMYSYRTPEPGEEGTVTTVAGPRGPMSSMRGPGGGLVYVEWDDTGFVGVSLLDIVKA